MVDDEPTIARLRMAGEQALAETLVAERDRLHRIIEHRMDPKLSGRVDPGDVLQETFLEARKRLTRYLEDPKVPVFVWLRGVALDTLINVHRRHVEAQRRDAGQEVSIQATAVNASSAANLARSLMAADTSPSNAVLREETHQMLERALEILDDIDREVLTMRHFEQLSNDEVAQILGVKKAAASRRYTRALEHIRVVLQALPGFEG
jgi:RNA polymerase sigma-70 factor (ECF subfamily)